MTRRHVATVRPMADVMERAADAIEAGCRRATRYLVPLLREYAAAVRSMDRDVVWEAWALKSRLGLPMRGLIEPVRPRRKRIARKRRTA